MKSWIKITVWSVFWVVSYFVLLGIFASSSEWQSIDHIYTLIFIGTLMMAVASSEYYRRRLLAGKAYKMWAVSLLAVIVIFAFFNQILFDKLIDFVLPGYYFISYYSFLNLLEFFGAFVGLTTLISLSMEWFRLQELEKEKSIAEFRALANQVNPHFLFNSLTVLYTLSLKDNKETSSAIIKLSDILRYVIYQSSESNVSVASEAAILRDYIDLQRYRVHPTTQIDFTEELSVNETTIAPMLLLPLVENAFKHGVHGETENAFVRMTLREQGGVVNFMITNNKSQIKTTAGIGLKNLKDRLKLIYPDKHSIIITETDNVFNVNMQISI